MCKLNGKNANRHQDLNLGSLFIMDMTNTLTTTAVQATIETDKFTTQCAHVNLSKYFSIVTSGVLSFLLGIPHRRFRMRVLQVRHPATIFRGWSGGVTNSARDFDLRMLGVSEWQVRVSACTLSLCGFFNL